MRAKKRTEITVETHRVLAISRRQISGRAWCSDCGEIVNRVTPEEAAVIAHVSARTIYRWIEAEQLHFTENQTGLLRICLNSLLIEARTPNRAG